MKSILLVILFGLPAAMPLVAAAGPALKRTVKPGLCKIAPDLGGDGRPLIEVPWKCRKKMDAWDGALHKLAAKARAVLDETLTEYDKKYGS